MTISTMQEVVSGLPREKRKPKYSKQARKYRRKLTMAYKKLGRMLNRREENWRYVRELVLTEQKYLRNRELFRD